MSDKVNLNDTIDASIWTEEWMKTITERPGIPTDEGTMIGWFANAIMAGFDEGQRQIESDKTQAVGWMYAQACSYVDEGIDIRKVLVTDIMQAMEEDFLSATGESNEPLPPYIAIGNNELGEELGEEILCPHCNKTHEVQYGTDEDGNETKILAFYECDVTGKSYVAGIDGKKIK